MSKYILKSSVPGCPAIPDMSKFVLKSSVPPPQQCPTCPPCNPAACPSPCKKIKKVVTCKKAPMVCSPIETTNTESIKLQINSAKKNIEANTSKPKKQNKTNIVSN